MRRVQVIRGDITKLNVDAIVNAANETLLGGGGVDGAIHRAAGPELLEECWTLNGCPTGRAKITGGYALPAKYVIHTVGPVYRDGKHGEPNQLASCYRSSMACAKAKGVKTIAFPCISTGVYHYHFADACAVALKTLADCLRENNAVEKVLLVCFSARDEQIYRELLAAYQ